ncbi:MAG: F0F1 ATP synthase subunit B [Bacteroidaceae bacterium]|nr:F0F1 ATP synthase subunit B [Bacteroidaceae bacterium]
MESLNLPSILTPDFGLLFWMLVAFIVLFVILSKFGFPAIINMVEERKSFIDESLKNARSANERLAGIQAESEQILRDAREQQAKILKEAAATKDAIIQEAKEKAVVAGQKLIEEAKMQIQAEKSAALQDLRSQVANLSIQIAEKVVGHNLKSTEAQENYIDGLLDQIESK